MSGQPWEDLTTALKEALTDICARNLESRVTIINFSSTAQVEYLEHKPDQINTNSLIFQNGWTNFDAAFSTGLTVIKQSKNNDLVLIFMTDGGGKFPQKPIDDIKSYLDEYACSSSLNLDFNAIGFHCNSSILNDLVAQLGGSKYFADSGVKLAGVYYEILNKKE